MSNPVRVLVVDDSALMRKMIPQLIETDNSIEVVGTAMDGNFGLRKIEELKPQVVTLDLEMPGMGGIEMLKEEARLANVDFNGRPSERPAIQVAQPELPALEGAVKMLDDAESLLVAKPVDQARLDKAKGLFLAALQETDQQALHAKSWYGLARIAMLQNDPETAEELFQKTLGLDPEPQDKAWTLYYLGRLAVAAGDRGRGIQLIQEALGLPGASEKARKAASDALQQIPKP